MWNNPRCKHSNGFDLQYIQVCERENEFRKASICLLSPWMLRMRFAARESVSAGRRRTTTAAKFNRFVSISPSKSFEHHCDPISGRLWEKMTPLSHGGRDLTAERVGGGGGLNIDVWGQQGGREVYNRGEECVKDTWIESNESREEHRHLFHLQVDLKRSFIIIIWKMCMLIAQTRLPAGRKDTFHFQRRHSPRFPLLLLLFRSCSVPSESAESLKTQCTPTARNTGQVTIIYPEISLVIVPDECMWKLRVKAGRQAHNAA